MNDVKLVKLKKKMKENRYSQGLIAQEIGLTPSAMSARMNQKTEWRLEEMSKIMNLLKIPPSQIVEYFS